MVFFFPASAQDQRASKEHVEQISTIKPIAASSASACDMREQLTLFQALPQARPHGCQS